MRASIAIVLALLFAGRAVRAEPAVDRVAEARRHVTETLRARFAHRGAVYPPRALYLRAFKLEGILEMWSEAADGRFVLIKSYPICASSGTLGPKRTEGDEQVPEGLYEVRVYNGKSRYHLSLGIDYPNASDRALGKTPLGGDIMIHGGCVTIGCIPLGDDAIEEVFVAAADARAAGKKTLVHVFPMVMSDHAMHALERAAPTPSVLALWRSLRPAFVAFERTHKLPRFRVDRATGLYVVEP